MYVNVHKYSFPVSNNWNKIGKIFITWKSNGFYQILDHKLKSKFPRGGDPETGQQCAQETSKRGYRGRPMTLKVLVRGRSSRPRRCFYIGGKPFPWFPGAVIKIIALPKVNTPYKQRINTFAGIDTREVARLASLFSSVPSSVAVVVHSARAREASVFHILLSLLFVIS